MSSSTDAIPDRPGGVAAAVQFIKLLQLLKGIHTRPEAIVRVGKQLSFGDQPPKGFFDQFVSLFDIFEDLTPEDEESTVDPRPGIGDVLNAFDNAFPVDRNHMKTRTRLDADKAGRFIAFEKILRKLTEVHIGEPICVVRQEDLL